MQHDKVKFTTIDQVKSHRQKSFTVDVLHIKVYKKMQNIQCGPYMFVYNR